MNYTLHQLKVFLKVAETLSVTKAAEELFLTQPAVSIQLKKLQEQFEISLTEVIGRQIYITDFGKEIATAAEKIITEAEAIQYKTEAYKGQLVGKLKISSASTGKYVMPFFLADFMKQHKGIDLMMDVTNKSRVIESLEKNEIDFALVSVLPEQIAIESLELMENKLYMVGNTDVIKEYKDKNDLLASLPFIYREAGSATRRAMEIYISHSSFPIRKKIELTSNEAIKQALIAGLGISIMPLIGIRGEIEKMRLSIIPMKGLPIITNWNLIWLKNKKLSPIAGAYLDYIRLKKNEIIESHFKK